MVTTSAAIPPVTISSRGTILIIFVTVRLFMLFRPDQYSNPESPQFRVTLNQPTICPVAVAL
jgi:uncharacterized protein (DUF736 family)